MYQPEWTSMCSYESYQFLEHHTNRQEPVLETPKIPLMQSLKLKRQSHLAAGCHTTGDQTKTANLQNPQFTPHP